MAVLPVAAAPACIASYIPVCCISVYQTSMDRAFLYKSDAKTEPMVRVLCTLSQTDTLSSAKRQLPDTCYSQWRLKLQLVRTAV